MFRLKTLVVALFFMSSIVFAEDIPTRFGLLQIDSENMLLYNNRPLNPEIQGNSRLITNETFQIGNKDIVLIQDVGGTACPSLFYFVSISINGIEATPPFGTCSDLIKTKQIAETISVRMAGFQGPFEPEEAKRKAAKEIYVFTFKNGVLTENGKIVR